jgi:hypothetical protein
LVSSAADVSVDAAPGIVREDAVAALAKAMRQHTSTTDH